MKICKVADLTAKEAPDLFESALILPTCLTLVWMMVTRDHVGHARAGGAFPLSDQCAARVCSFLKTQTWIQRVSRSIQRHAFVAKMIKSTCSIQKKDTF